MYMNKPFALLAAAVLLSTVSCFAQAKAPTTNDPGILGEKRSQSFYVRLLSSPAPPIRGLGALEAFVADAAGKPVADAEVTFNLDMIAMSHGKNLVLARSRGEGSYIGQVRYMMPGTWKVIVRISRPGQDPEDLRFDYDVKFR
jgi:hypothetical protein